MTWLRFNSWPISVHLRVWSVLPLVLCMLVLSAGCSMYERIQTTNALTSSSWMTLTGAGGLLQSVVDLETGVRRHMLTADPDFLQPYDERLPVVTEQLAQASELVQDRRELIGPGMGRRSGW